MDAQEHVHVSAEQIRAGVVAEDDARGQARVDIDQVQLPGFLVAHVVDAQEPVQPRWAMRARSKVSAASCLMTGRKELVPPRRG